MCHLSMKSAALLVFVCGTGLSLGAATPIRSLHCSPDVTVVLGGVTLDDENLAEDDLAGAITSMTLGVLPPEAGVSAYHLLAGGDHLLSLDTAAELPGGILALPGDVVRFDGADFFLVFAAASADLPPGLATDAITVIGGTDLLLSFDLPVDLDGILVDDEDLVRFDGAGLSLFFDGSAAGIPQELDVDATHILEGQGRLFLSLDGSGSVGGVDFDDEDVLEYDLVAGTWEMAYDGSAHHPAWHEADLNAVFLVPRCVDTDGDGYGLPADPACPNGAVPDCDDDDGNTFPGAPETNDGRDNQCPGEPGYGAIDEISGETGFPDPADETRYCWTAQIGSASYQVARAVSPDFSAGCVTFITTASATCVLDGVEPPMGGVFFYLVRSLTPNLGSWGLRSSGMERSVSCGG